MRSIGMHVWAVTFVFLIGILQKKRELMLICIPLLTIILTLLVSTPIYNEFRYAYSVFTTFPLIVLTFLDFISGDPNTGIEPSGQ